MATEMHTGPPFFNLLSRSAVWDERLGTKPEGTKQKLVHELRRLVAISLYLFGFFAVFRLYTRLVLEEYEIDYFRHGLTLLKSLALAKIILTGETFRLGETSGRWRLVALTLYFAVVFSVFALAFELLEHFVLVNDAAINFRKELNLPFATLGTLGSRIGEARRAGDPVALANAASELAVAEKVSD
jgi:hypothetical protein